MVSTHSQLATIIILVLGVSSVAGAPVSLKDLGHLETTDGKPVYHNNPVVYSKRADESIATRSSKYAIDYLPTWAVAAPDAEPTKADAKKDTKMPNPSKYAIDYLPSWAVTVKAAASATNEAEKDAVRVLMATTESPAPPATTSTRALKYNISKYAIDYLPTRAADVSEAEATVAAADEDKATPLATRSSKYAVDYHPTWVANGPAEATGAADEDKAAPIATRSSKYAVDYHPTWVAGTPVVEATAAADEQN